MKIVFATSNQHKLKELREIVSENGIKDIEIIMPPDGFDPIEDGETFEANSLIKAKEASRLTGEMALADDSGLCVEALNGLPGIYSARYANTQEEKINKLLNELETTDNRKAKFVCAMTLVGKNGEILFADRGECFGEISKQPAGCGGFGYDPIFIVEGKSGLTMAELSEEEKNEVSHRGRALQKLFKYLSETGLPFEQ